MYYSKNHGKVAFSARVNNKTTFGQYVYVGKRTRIKSTDIGDYSYIGNDSNLSNCIIGKFCSIGSNVEVINGFHPTSVFVSTHPAFYSISNRNIASFVHHNKFNEYRFSTDDKYVEIGNDCWIGSNVIILAGVKIGDGSIIGAGSIVTKNISDYSICTGIPARVIKYRFDSSDIEFLKDLQWWHKDSIWIRNNADLFEDIDSLKKRVNTCQM